jgi:hypothetical protein
MRRSLSNLLRDLGCEAIDADACCDHDSRLCRCRYVPPKMPFLLVSMPSRLEQVFTRLKCPIGATSDRYD